MAIYGRGQMLGSGINPESFKQDFSGFADAAKMQAQGIASLGQSIGGMIQDYGKIKKQQQEDERAVQKSKSVAKAIGDLIPDLKPTLQNSLMLLEDKELPLSQRKAEADAISDILTLGIGAITNKQKLDLERSQIEAATNAAKAKAETARRVAPTIQEFGGPGGKYDLQWNPDTGNWENPRVNLPGVGQMQSGIEGGGVLSALQGVGLVDLVKGFEGFNPQAYGDFKQTSIGYGTRGKPGEVITEAEANNRLQTELTGHARNIQNAAAAQGITLNENQFNALTSFDFNTGKGADLINRFGRNPEQLASKMLEYTKAGGQDLPGLVKRRQVEAALFLGGQPTTTTAQGVIGFTPNKKVDSRVLTPEEKSLRNLPMENEYLGLFENDQLKGTPTVIPAKADPIATERSKAMDAPNISLFEAGQTAAQRLPNIQEAYNLLESDSVKTGTFAEYKVAAKRLFNQDVSNEEQFMSLVGNLAMEAIDLTKGAISDREMTFFREQLAPSLNKSVEGNKKILKFKIDKAKRDIEISKKVSELFEKKASPSEIQAEVAKMIEKKPLVTGENASTAAPTNNAPATGLDALEAKHPSP